jgi:serine/threonine protein phosphatase PrpC
LRVEVTTASAACGERSEDRLVTTRRDDATAIVLADGAGGLVAGAAAADAFCDAVMKHLERARDWFDVRALATVFESVDASLSVGETTAVVVIVSPHAMAGLSAGDSEAWVIRGAHIDRLTASQNRARVGSRRVRPVLFHRRWLAGTLVVATDGLFAHASAEAIARSCDRAETLVALPRLPSGAYPDDVAVAVVR